MWKTSCGQGHLRIHLKRCKARKVEWKSREPAETTESLFVDRTGLCTTQCVPQCVPQSAVEVIAHLHARTGAGCSRDPTHGATVAQLKQAAPARTTPTRGTSASSPSISRYSRYSTHSRLQTVRCKAWHSRHGRLSSKPCHCGCSRATDSKLEFR